MILLRLPTPNLVFKISRIFDKLNIPYQIVPTPRELDPSCNLSIKINKKELTEVQNILKENDILQYEINRYE